MTRILEPVDAPKVGTSILKDTGEMSYPNIPVIHTIEEQNIMGKRTTIRSCSNQWQVIEYRVRCRPLPIDADNQDALQTLESLMWMGDAKVIATCHRRDDARILARALNEEQRLRDAQAANVRVEQYRQRMLS